jgi:hypothetical protein
MPDCHTTHILRNIYPVLVLMTIALLPMTSAGAVTSPAEVVAHSGDQSVVLHWDRNPEAGAVGYNIYRAMSADGLFTKQTARPLVLLSYADLSVTNDQTYFYQVTAQLSSGEESLPSKAVPVTPRVFRDDAAFLDYVQHTAFDYFWYEANPTNGLVRDRSETTSPCSIAAVGFGLTAIGIGIDHGWISRDQGRQRTLTTLKTFWEGPQGTNRSGTIGYRGWFYHFLDMNSATRFVRFNTELSSIDTVWLLAGALYAKQYFNGPEADEGTIRSLTDALLNRVDWNWMAHGTNRLDMGWQPDTGFIGAFWTGYSEGMMAYVLGLGAATNALPASAWAWWTHGYAWQTNYGQADVPFAPLFGHQYSHCWLDFRYNADAFLNAKGSTYFENSRRATLAQRAYCIANPQHWPGYGSNIWGLTACDGPHGYEARGAPPPQNDDGTIAPTAAGGSMPFTPEYSLPALRAFYDQFRVQIWTGYGFRDAFNLSLNWWGPDTLGIDQGPIIIMIENYLTQRVWRLFMKNEAVQRGLRRAGFADLPFVKPQLTLTPGTNTVALHWARSAGRTYQVEYSSDLNSWFAAPAGRVTSNGDQVPWLDTALPPMSAPRTGSAQRFYRVFQFGPP